MHQHLQRLRQDVGAIAIVFQLHATDLIAIQLRHYHFDALAVEVQLVVTLDVDRTGDIEHQMCRTGRKSFEPAQYLFLLRRLCGTHPAMMRQQRLTLAAGHGGTGCDQHIGVDNITRKPRLARLRALASPGCACFNSGPTPYSAESTA
jgi:hypothetical protein